MPVPPLPGMTELLEASASFAERPGLRDQARLWLAWGPPARARVREEADALARPSLRPRTLRAVDAPGQTWLEAWPPGCATTPSDGCWTGRWNPAPP